MLICDPLKRISPIDALQHPFFTQEYNWCDVNSPQLESTTGSIRKRRSGILSSDVDSRSPKKMRKRNSLQLFCQRPNSHD